MDTFLPPPAGVESIRAWQDATSGAWYVDRLPLLCVKVHRVEFDELKFDALNLDGDWLGSITINNALALADGRVIRPGETIYSCVDDWLAAVKLGALPGG